ncbi:MAG: tetratricopeptide repeat protein [Acidobacteriaceae bacterium]
MFVAQPIALAQASAVSKLKSEAEQAQTAGKDDLALDLYAKALQQDSDWTEGWWKYGGLLYDRQQFKAAGDAFAHLTQLAPRNSLGFALLGLCEYQQGDWSNASLHLNKALGQGGLPPDIANGAMYAFGLVLMRKKNRNGAIIAFRLLQHENPNYPNLVPALGSAELNLEKIPGADQPNYAAVNVAGQAAIAVLELKEPEAERLYRQLVQENPNLPFAHLCLALFLINQGREAEAEEQLKAESVVNTTTPDPWVWLARLTLARRDAADARTDAERALQISPNDGLTYLILGRSFMIDQQWDKALTALHRAEALTPDNYEVHYSLAAVYTSLHQPDEAASERKMFVQAYALAHLPGQDNTR